MERVIENADISILSNFLTIFFRIFVSITINFTKYCLHTKFLINWTIQTEITEGAESTSPHPTIPIWKSLFRVKELNDLSFDTFDNENCIRNTHNHRIKITRLYLNPVRILDKFPFECYTVWIGFLRQKLEVAL